LDPEGARFRLFDATTEFLRGAARAAPLLIVLDDLNAADAPSLLLLQFAAAGLADARILLVCTYRDIDLASGDPLAVSVRELARHGLTRRLHLGGLRERDVARFIELTTGVVPPAGLVGVVHTETEGNPLFVGEVVRLLADEGRLETVASEPSWRLRIPQSIRDVIERRLARLSEECNQALTFASVIGREFGLDALERFANLAPEELLEVLDLAMEA